MCREEQRQLQLLILVPQHFHHSTGWFPVEEEMWLKLIIWLFNQQKMKNCGFHSNCFSGIYTL